MSDLSRATELDKAPSSRTLHCLHCRREGPTGSQICPDCGDALFERGYCPVCEDDLLLPIGACCPKHEVDLIERPGETQALFSGAEAPSWITIATYSDASQAEAPRLRLEAEGIPTFLDGARMGSLSMYQVATGGVKLQVPAPLVPEARVLLTQLWTPPSTNDDHLDDAWDELAPDPGERLRRIMKGVIVFILFTPLVLIVLGWLFALVTRE